MARRQFDTILLTIEYEFGNPVAFKDGRTWKAHYILNAYTVCYIVHRKVTVLLRCEQRLVARLLLFLLVF
jgi:hypothetical protein